jgi:hypothetical protein
MAEQDQSVEKQVLDLKETIEDSVKIAEDLAFLRRVRESSILVQNQRMMAKFYLEFNYGN